MFLTFLRSYRYISSPVHLDYSTIISPPKEGVMDTVEKVALEMVVLWPRVEKSFSFRRIRKVPSSLDHTTRFSPGALGPRF